MTAAGSVAAARTAEVLARLALVTDPELDESVTELGFVTDTRVTPDGGVRIGFRLPTYWCAANFAFMMAEDMRAALADLPWITDVGIELDAHMYGDEINRGLAEGRSFQQTFGDAATGDLTEVRRTFLVKSFQRRQETLLRHLMAAGISAHELVTMSLPALAMLPTEAETGRLVARYIERRGLAGPGGPAFVDIDGGRLDPDLLPRYLDALRRVGVNMEFNGALCRGLLAARYGEGEARPELLDFLPTHATAHEARPA